MVSLPLQKKMFFSFIHIGMNFIMMKACFNNQIFQARNDSNADFDLASFSEGLKK